MNLLGSLCPFYVPVPMGRHHQVSLAPGSMLVSLAPNLLHGTCILHKKVVLGLMGPEGGAYAPQKGSLRLSACGVSAGTGRGMAVAVAEGNW